MPRIGSASLHPNSAIAACAVIKGVTRRRLNRGRCRRCHNSTATETHMSEKTTLKIQNPVPATEYHAYPTFFTPAKKKSVKLLRKSRQCSEYTVHTTALG